MGLQKASFLKAFRFLGYLPKAWVLTSSSDSSKVPTGSRTGKERRGAPLAAISAPVGGGGAGVGGVG